MQVDLAGTTNSYYDCVTGDAYDAYLFATVLSCSCYAYTQKILPKVLIGSKISAKR